MRQLFLLLFAATIAAGDGGLSGIDGMLLPVSPPRSGRPMVVEVRLSSRLGAREGQAVIVLKGDEGEAARWEGPVWRVGSESTAFRVLLPPARGWEGYDDLRAELSWHEGKLAFPLAIQSLARAGLDVRAVAELSPAGIEPRRDLVMLPPQVDANAAQPPRVSVVRIDPADAATAPEAWQAWDAVLLHPQTALPPPVREALAAWLLAGGRLMLASGNPGPEVGELLATLERARGPVLPGDGWLSWRAGLGQVVQDGGGEPEAAALALWGKPHAVHRWNDTYQPESDLGQLLWPEAVGRVPLSLVLVVFAAFLLWVGPVEWIVLGRLRRRRWTWITFPLAAIVATIAVTAIARGAFGSSDHVRRLVLVDCDAGGVARRCNIIEQRFAGGDRVLEEQPQGELVLPIEASSGRYRGDGAAVRVRAVHRGPWHAGGSVEVTLPQWTPVLLRRYSLQPPAGLPRADFGPAPSPEAAAHDVNALLRDGWRYAAVSPGEHEAGDVRVFAGPRREGFPSGEEVWHRIRRGLTGTVRGPLADLASPRPCRIVVQQLGTDIIIWRQELPTVEKVHDEKPE